MDIWDLQNRIRDKSTSKDYDFETSYTGGDGWVAFATEDYTRYENRGAGKDGLTRVAIPSKRAVFRRSDGGGAAAATTQPDNRSTGEYEDIINSLQIDQQAALDQAAALRAQEAQRFQTNFDELTAGFNQQIENLNTANAANIAGLNQRYDEQATAFSEFQTLASDQLATAEANYQDQLRMTQNLQTAFVPTPNASAAAAAIGDQRPETTRRARDNRLSGLSSLSIVSGLGTASNPLSGLQLA